MRIDAITIFPDYFAPLQLSLLGKAQDGGLLSINVHDLRAQTSDTHHTVDDAPVSYTHLTLPTKRIV